MRGSLSRGSLSRGSLSRGLPPEMRLPTPVDRMTGASKNITFQQLRWRVVKFDEFIQLVAYQSFKISTDVLSASTFLYR